MFTPEIGSKWQVTHRDSAGPRRFDSRECVTVVGLETTHALVEYRDRPAEWGTPVRKWVSLGLFQGEALEGWFS